MNTMQSNNAAGFPIRQDITVLPADEKWESEDENPLVRLIEDAYAAMFEGKHRLGWVVMNKLACVW
jgi:hypothetical protein